MPLAADAGAAEVAVAESVGDDDERYAFVGHLDGARVSRLTGA
jgi:hypothetical protein